MSRAPRDPLDPSPPRRRVVLFLEGPASPFLRRVADRVIEAGHAVRHVAFCLGDLVFWRLITGLPFRDRRPAPPSIFWKGERADWPAFLEGLIERDGITDVVMLGDGRPVHAAAIPVAQSRGVRVHILEHGYLRPDRLTLEPDGMSGRSRMPRDPATILAMAEGLPPIDLRPLWRHSELRYSLYDLAYHLPNVVLGPFVHRHYRTHGPVHPLIEYAGWALRQLKAPLERRRLAATLPAFLDGRRRFFLFPLQLAGDWQIRLHAPGGDLSALVEATLASFAAAAPADRHLLFKVHPIDNGLADRREAIGRAAAALGIADRVAVIVGGPLDALIAAADGVVLVNSTVGVTALLAGRPVFTLGNAVYDVEGMVAAGPLDAFWTAPTPPDPHLTDAFFRLMQNDIQPRGGFVAKEAVEVGAVNVAERLVSDLEALPPVDRSGSRAETLHARRIVGTGRCREA